MFIRHSEFQRWLSFRTPKGVRNLDSISISTLYTLGEVRMLVVLSDLHFVEESSHYIEGVDPLAYVHNLSKRPFQRLMIRLADEAVRNKVERLDFVLAGDIFDLHRTAMWFTDNQTGVRPYLPATPEAVNGELEALLLRIIEKIAAEPMVAGTLAVFRLLANGRYTIKSSDGEEVELDFPVPVTIHHFVGNHDRMGNATPAIRNAIRRHLGLPQSGKPFERVLIFEREQTLVRHGQEYDRYNFAHDHSHGQPIPTRLPDSQYADPAFGDFITIDVASRLPYEFRQYHGDDKIINDPMLRHLYKRLTGFDDLRPMGAMFNYFMHMPDVWFEEELVWQAIEPVLIRMLETLHDDPFLHRWLKVYDKRWQPDAVDAVQFLLKTKTWRLTGLPISAVQAASDAALSGAHNIMGAETYAMREEGVKNGRFRFIVAGHTHSPQVALIAHEAAGETYYVDTGTWRNRLPATPDFKGFGRLKALTYVTIYGDRENLAKSVLPLRAASFDYWSGMTERWDEELSAVSGI